MCRRAPIISHLLFADENFFHHERSVDRDREGSGGEEKEVWMIKKSLKGDSATCNTKITLQ